MLLDFRQLLSVAGPGLAVSLTFLDPGNLQADLQMGAKTGYNLLWALAWSVGMGLFIQLLAARLGVVTGKGLAEHCRDAFPAWLSCWVICPLMMCAVTASDVQQILGTAVAVNILFGGTIPLWIGALTSSVINAGVLVCVLGERDDDDDGSKLELVFSLFIFTLLVCFAATLTQTGFNVEQAARGLFVPRVPAHGMLQTVGTLGATVMPHNLFLHSFLVTRTTTTTTTNNNNDKSSIHDRIKYVTLESVLTLSVALLINLCVVLTFAVAFYDPECASLARLPDGTCGKIGFADTGAALAGAIGGQASPYIWAIGLLAASQASTLTGTIAGGAVLEGFSARPVPLWQRVGAVRSVALAVALIVVVAATTTTSSVVDEAGEAINIVQSMTLPFAMIPLLRLTRHAKVMGADHVSGVVRQAVGLCICLAAVSVNFVLVALGLGEESNRLVPGGLIVAVVMLAVYLTLMSCMLAVDLKCPGDAPLPASVTVAAATTALHDDEVLLRLTDAL